MSTSSRQIPRDAQVIQAILKDMGVTEYEPRVVNQLLEFVYRYVTTVLDDAKAYANHAKKKGIDLDDVKLAVSMQMEQSFTTPPPREILMEVARSKNSTPLPTIKPHCGIRLPPDRYCLSACNYKLKVPKKTGTKSSISTSSTSSPRMSGVLGGRAVIRPNSPAVRVQTRPIVKVNTSGASGPKIQIAVPSLPTASINLPLPPQDSEGSKGIKREREEDDYDAP